MAYRTAADTTNPWLPPTPHIASGGALGASYGKENFPLPYGQGDWRKVLGRQNALSGFYQKDSFPLPYGQWSHSRRRSSGSCSGSCGGHPTPSKMATMMAQSLHAPAAITVGPAVAPPDGTTCGSLATGIAIGAGLLFLASKFLR